LPRWIGAGSGASSSAPLTGAGAETGAAGGYGAGALTQPTRLPTINATRKTCRLHPDG